MNTFVTTGTLSGSTVVLDEPLPKCEGKVRVTVEVVEQAPPKQAWREVLEKIWAAQNARGHVPMTVEEVEAHIKAERDSWED